jgi:hypothetical protein
MMTVSAASGDNEPPPTLSPEDNSHQALSPEAAEATRSKRFEVILEIVAVALLGIATLTTSWSGYQASRWGGVQSTLYSQASALRVESMRAATAAGQTRNLDVGLFTNWANAYAQENELLTNFYQERFRPEFVPAFEAWVATRPLQNPDAPPSPFAMPEYVLELDVQATQLEQEAADTFAEGQDANQISDDYVLNAVLLASVLFLSGVAQRFNVKAIRILIIALAIIVCIIGLYNVATYPIW